MTSVASIANSESAARPGPASSGGGGPSVSWIVAAFLSLVAPGLGHVYERQTRRGLVWFASRIVLGLIVPASMRLRGSVFVIVLLILTTNGFAFALAAAVDAVRLVRQPAVSRASWGRVGIAAIAMIAVSQLWSVALKQFFIESFKNPSGSMIPTIFTGDHFFIDKVRSPAWGDLVVFPFPEHPDQGFVKRIVGMPGDTLYFRRGGHPVINGIEVPSCLVGEASYPDPGGGPVHAGQVYLEVLGARRYLTFYDDNLGMGGVEQGPYTVKAGEVFVVGDNRHNSHDSRMWNLGAGGGVPLSTVNGVAFVVWLPVSDHGIDWAREGMDLRELAVPPGLGELQPGIDACTAKIAGTST
jgi:signal peptidase I